ncbi:winged helix DNA-binding protein [Comamonas sp. Y33R10-2]|uniref:MarR family winged helix-turn-helix transcriptional regulator n=1 Tax=Comamonas sp. Y33R10-2 TaxID=2853257 RepID=UPI001C5C98E7|nr:MarR family transcriptional regulator [Comamonas sp. Y33R10-2]QXZ09582.1 winged helix DNA-binding protein [Comamonas sp. Y33R10-2]
MSQEANHASPQENYQVSAQIGHLLRRAYQRHSSFFQQSIPNAQLTTAQFVVLCTVREHSGSSLAEIVKAAVIDQATIRGVVDRLKQRDLLNVDLDANDKRKVVLTLTPKGLELIKVVEPIAMQITESTYGKLNPAERFALDFLLKKMLDDPQD